MANTIRWHGGDIDKDLGETDDLGVQLRVKAQPDPRISIKDRAAMNQVAQRHNGHGAGHGQNGDDGKVTLISVADKTRLVRFLFSKKRATKQRIKAQRQASANAISHTRGMTCQSRRQRD